MRVALGITCSLWVTACGAPGGAQPAPPSVSAARDVPPARPPRAPVASCPATAAPQDASLDPRLEIGVVAGVTWLFGYAGGDAVLAHLGPDGAPVLTPVPLHNTQAVAVEGERVWLYAPTEGPGVPTRWTAVDLRDPGAPVPGAVVPVAVGSKSDHAGALAVGPRRALVVTGSGDERELVVLDPATRTAVRAPQPLGPGFLPVRATCADDRCAVVGVADEGGGPSRRLVVVRARADGATEREQLAPGWISEPHVEALGDELVVLWRGHEGMSLRVLDRQGRPRGPAVPVPWDSSKNRVRREALLTGDGALRLAVGEPERWSVAAVGPAGALGPFRELPTRSYALFGAVLDDGLAWVGRDSDVSYDQIAPSGPNLHSWRSQLLAGFLPSTGDGPAPTPLASTGGPGRGGLEVFVLARPGAAAALLVPRGDAASFSGETTRLVPLRAPCPPR